MISLFWTWHDATLVFKAPLLFITHICKLLTLSHESSSAMIGCRKKIANILALKMVGMILKSIECMTSNILDRNNVIEYLSFIVRLDNSAWHSFKWHHGFTKYLRSMTGQQGHRIEENEHWMPFTVSDFLKGKVQGRRKVSAALQKAPCHQS